MRQKMGAGLFSVVLVLRPIYTGQRFLLGITPPLGGSALVFGLSSPT